MGESMNVGLRALSASTDPFEQVIEAAHPVSLGEMNESAALMTRAEQKYFAPARVFAELFDQGGGLRVLEIDGERHHQYRSLYFDTPDLRFLRQHVQGRRLRSKVRIRTYGSGESFLEVKSKGNRGATVKNRIPLPSAPVLTPEAQEFIDHHLEQGGAARAMGPVLETRYQRVTLLQGVNRITCDLNLEFRAGEFCTGRAPRRVHRGPSEILIETKSPTGRSVIDKKLRALSIRPVAVSKYGVGLSLLRPQLPANRWNRVLRSYFDYHPVREPLKVHNLLNRNDTGVTTPRVKSCAQ